MYLFPNAKGGPLDNLSRHVQSLAKSLGIDLPTSTVGRHTAATTAVTKCTETQQNAVSVCSSGFNPFILSYDNDLLATVLLYRNVCIRHTSCIYPNMSIFQWEEEGSLRIVSSNAVLG